MGWITFTFEFLTLRPGSKVDFGAPSDVDVSSASASEEDSLRKAKAAQLKLTLGHQRVYVIRLLLRRVMWMPSHWVLNTTFVN